MITWSRVTEEGKEEVIKQFKTFGEAVKYFENQKDPEEPEPVPNGCWNCMNFDWKHEACTTRWNNLDEDYYNPDIDDRELTDICDDWTEDHDADPECIDFGGNEP